MKNDLTQKLAEETRARKAAEQPLSGAAKRKLAAERAAKAAQAATVEG